MVAAKMAVNAPTEATIVERVRRQLEQRARARDHVHAGGDHGGRVDQRGNGGRAFHRVGQPDVQRELRGFAGGADEHQQRDRAEDAEARDFGVELAAAEDGVDVREAQRAEDRQHEQHAEQEAGVADAVDDERLLARIARGLLVEVEADQQVAAQTDAFPADEQQRVVVRQHQHQHEEDEQVQVAEEAVVAIVVVHVAGGVDVDEEADAGDDQDHDGAERIEQEAPVGGEGGQLAVGHVEGQTGDPGELDDLLWRARAVAKAARRRPPRSRNESSTMPGQMNLISDRSGERGA